MHQSVQQGRRRGEKAAPGEWKPRGALLLFRVWLTTNERPQLNSSPVNEGRAVHPLQPTPLARVARPPLHPHSPEVLQLRQRRHDARLKVLRVALLPGEHDLQGIKGWLSCAL